MKCKVLHLVGNWNSLGKQNITNEQLFTFLDKYTVTVISRYIMQLHDRTSVPLCRLFLKIITYSKGQRIVRVADCNCMHFFVLASIKCNNLSGICSRYNCKDTSVSSYSVFRVPTQHLHTKLHTIGTIKLYFTCSSILDIPILAYY